MSYELCTMSYVLCTMSFVLYIMSYVLMMMVVMMMLAMTNYGPQKGLPTLSPNIPHNGPLTLWLDGPTNRPSSWDHQRDQQLWQIKCSKNWLTNLGPPTLALQRTLWLQDQMAYIMDNQICTTKGTTKLVRPNGLQTWWPYGLPNGPPNWEPNWTIDK